MATTSEETGTRSRPAPRQLAIMGGLAAVLLFLLWFLVLRDGGAPEEETPSPVPAAEPATPRPAPAPADQPGGGGGGSGGAGGPVETFEVFASRDPFDPLISASSGTTAGTTAGTTSGTTSGTTGTNGSGDGTGGGDDGGTTIEGHRVSVIDVYEKGGGARAQVEVDGTVYTADEGEAFADNFKLISASGECASMLYGDDQFTLCEGEEILK
ncbi:MAG: hypothetical protein ABR529_01815 [Actinomycetota bacterium]